MQVSDMKKQCETCKQIFAKKYEESKPYFLRKRFCSKECNKTLFKPGNNPWCAGLTKKSASTISGGNPNWVKGHKPWNQGMKGITLDPKASEHLAIGRAWNKGLKMTSEQIGIRPRGLEHKSWKGGKSAWCHIEARRLMQAQIGRALTKKEIVHHIDENPVNNDPENLWLTDYSEHRLLHQEIKTHKHLMN